MLPMQPFPKHPIPLESCANHGGATLPASKPKGTKEGVGYFQGGTLLSAKALARRIRHPMPERILDPVCVFNHIVNYQSTVMEKATKNRLGGHLSAFRCRQPLPYNCDFDMFELREEPYHRQTILVPGLMEYLCIASPFERGFTSKVSFTYSAEYGGSRCILLNGRSHSDPHF
ncbi:hypothetical protein TNCV_1792841 [Trichonephila clavipes]|nr:hypothetical protein TNCV_1792841 [Trichonephila clavipes]